MCMALCYAVSVIFELSIIYKISLSFIYIYILHKNIQRYAVTQSVSVTLIRILQQKNFTLWQGRNGRKVCSTALILLVSRSLKAM
jgi:hypothetical protein